MSVSAIWILTTHVEPLTWPLICLSVFLIICIVFFVAFHTRCKQLSDHNGSLFSFLFSLLSTSPFHTHDFFKLLVWGSTEFQDHLYGSTLESSLWSLVGSLVGTHLKRMTVFPQSLSGPRNGGQTPWASLHPWLTITRSPVGSHTWETLSALAVSCPEDSIYCPSPPHCQALHILSTSSSSMTFELYRE